MAHGRIFFEFPRYSADQWHFSKQVHTLYFDQPLKGWFILIGSKLQPIPKKANPKKTTDSIY